MTLTGTKSTMVITKFINRSIIIVTRGDEDTSHSPIVRTAVILFRPKYVKNDYCKKN